MRCAGASGGVFTRGGGASTGGVALRGGGAIAGVPRAEEDEGARMSSQPIMDELRLWAGGVDAAGGASMSKSRPESRSMLLGADVFGPAMRATKVDCRAGGRPAGPRGGGASGDGSLDELED